MTGNNLVFSQSIHYILELILTSSIYKDLILQKYVKNQILT